MLIRTQFQHLTPRKIYFKGQVGDQNKVTGYDRIIIFYFYLLDGPIR